MRQSFIPPKTNPLFVAFFKAILPLLYRYLLGGLQIKISPSDLKRLAALKGERMLLLPNHPSEFDPYIPFEISKQLGETFNFVAAREAFDWNWGLRGKAFQLGGVYSLIRGAVDRESFKMTREILAQGKNRLVIFIEGEVTNENDTLIPFEPGVIQLAFWALEDAIKQQKQQGNNEIPNLYLTPIAIKYKYREGAEQSIEHALSQLETETGVERAQDSYSRILTIGEKVLSIQEKRLNIATQPGQSIDERIELIKNRLLGKIESFMDLSPGPQESFLSRLRTVRNRIDKMVYTYQEPPHLSNYEKRTLELLRTELKGFYDELERLVNLLVLHEGYIHENHAPERYIDVIRRLEREVYGHPKLLHHRTAMVRIGEIVNLKDYLEAYNKDKKQATQSLAHQLESETAALLRD